MRIPRSDVPVKLAVPGATARQLPGFGSAEGCGTMAAEFFSLGAGTDIAPLLVGLEGDSCQAPHWGHVLEGELVVTYTDGSQETCVAGDLFHWPPGHNVRVEADSEIVMFSPQDEHSRVIRHMADKLGAA